VKDRDRYQAIRATYTNCAVGNDDWFMKVQRLDIDRLRDVGEARGATLYFEHVPILYTPWLDFPLSSRRKSGSSPAFGTTNSMGFRSSHLLLEHQAEYGLYDRASRNVLARRVAGQRVPVPRPQVQGLLEADVLPDD
jgi:LPS-assembly protein